MNNKALERSLDLLSRPLALATIGLLLINDWVLRIVWPSWWTGKIGDLAWLFFFPFVLALPLAWLVPPRLARQESIVRWLAFGLTAGAFVLTKTSPFAHDVTVRALELLLGNPVGLKRDPTDLVALISLAGAWWLWEREPAPRTWRTKRAWLALSMGVLLTVGNMAAPDYGVEVLAVADDGLLARASRYTFFSEDGGLTWGESDVQMPTDEEERSQPSSQQLRYRFAPGESIEVSEDGGKTWPHTYAIPPTGQAARAYYEKRTSLAMYQPGPLDAAVDPGTGHVVFAMGLEGVLVFTPDESWTWAEVGRYKRVKLDTAGEMVELLGGEILVAVGFGLLSVLTLGLRMRRGWIWSAVVIGGWILWLLQTAVFPPALDAWSYLAGLSSALLWGGVIVAGVLALWTFAVVAGRSLARLAHLAAVGVGGAALFFLPFVLWALNVLPRYGVTLACGLVLGGGAVLVGWVAAPELPASEANGSDMEGAAPEPQ